MSNNIVIAITSIVCITIVSIVCIFAILAYLKEKTILKYKNSNNEMSITVNSDKNSKN